MFETPDRLAELAGLTAIAAAAAFTPGPNNALLSASGAAFGLRRTLPHAQGVTWGFPAMIFVVALGLGEAFRESALLREALRWTGAAVMAWLAWRIATAGGAEARARRRPFTFLEAAGFQWINPKAWMMCAAIAPQYAKGAAPLAEAATLAAVFALVGAASSHAWAGAGAALGRWLGTGARLRAFNLAMAAMLLLGVAALLTEDLTPG